MANTVYDNIVLSNKMNDILKTKVDLNSYLTIDTSMTEQAGMKKVINTYTATGNVEDLAMGAGNTDDISVSFTSAEYEVKTTQGRFQYYDEQAMKDPMVVEAGLEGIAKTMVNDFTTKAIAEFDKTTTTVEAVAYNFAMVVDAIAAMNVESEEGMFLLISPADQADFRKGLNNDLKYAESFVRTGYIGTVCGVPVIISKALTKGKMFLATKEAVTLFIKKDTEIEQVRDADTRNNTVYIRKVAVVALTDATKAVKITVAGQ